MEATTFHKHGLHSHSTRELYGVCWKSGEWSVTGSECLGMCVPEVRYGGEERNTATLYQSYTEIQVTTDLVGCHLSRIILGS